jgi:uncharacterized protein (TIGR04552 family)
VEVSGVEDVDSRELSDQARRLVRLLTLSELEQVRLILRGGSAVDWFRLQHESVEDVKAFLRLQGALDDDPEDAARLVQLRDSAAKYLQDEHAYKLPSELLTCDPIELFLYASEKRGRRRDRFFACMLLKVMHIVHHIEARELRFHMPLSQWKLAQLLVDKIDAFAQQLRAEGLPLVEYAGGEKSQASLVTKLLVKKEHHAATIHDRVRFRFVVDQPLDVIDLLARMTSTLFPYNYVAPGQAVNLLVNFTALIESIEEYRKQAAELQIELGHEEQLLLTVNEFSGATYRVVNFIVDVPLRVPDELLAITTEREGLGKVIFGLAEIQVVDQATDEDNARGDNRHDRYRARQLMKVRDRLERGMRGVREEDLA